MNEHKVILLDIDGVIAPLYSTDEEFHLIDIQWTRFTIPIKIAEFIKDISNSVNIIWSSSWEKDSCVVSEELNFNIDNYISFPESSGNDWFKINELKKFIEDNNNKQIMIIDDELCEFSSEFNLYDNLTIVCPDDRVGLSLKNMKEIEQWLAN